jgi:formylglycine-generating enzyme required for sulfatase activity
MIRPSKLSSQVTLTFILSILLAALIAGCSAQSPAPATPTVALLLPTVSTLEAITPTRLPSAIPLASPTDTPSPTNMPVAATETPSAPVSTALSVVITKALVPTNTPSLGSTTRINPSDGAVLVYIPEGEFLMGSDLATDPYIYGAEMPSHPVYVDAFWIYQTEVTNAMYQACVAAKTCPLPVRVSSDTRSEYYGNSRFENYPVVQVTWKDAVVYCSWAGGRLPYEAEWEKAGRGTDGRLFPWGSQPPGTDQAQFNTTDTAPVGSFSDGASPYGVLDMSGNVIEWVFDYFQSAYYSVSPYENPHGPATGSTRVYRGGAYHNHAAAVRVVMRGSRREGFAGVDIGFRCAVGAINQ